MEDNIRIMDSNGTEYPIGTKVGSLIKYTDRRGNRQYTLVHFGDGMKKLNQIKRMTLLPSSRFTKTTPVFVYDPTRRED
jgi:hypothetical protein